MSELYKDKEWLNNQYWNEKRNAYEIAESCNCTNGTIYNWMNKFNIQRRTNSEAQKGKSSWCKGLTKETNESVRRISEGNKGKKLSEATKEKMSKSKTGEKNPRWKGGQYKELGYILILKLDNPHSDRHGYVREHRLIMEDHLGRYLKLEERIHHINGIKDDNRIENLMLFLNESEHQKYEYKLGNSNVGKYTLRVEN